MKIIHLKRTMEDEGAVVDRESARETPVLITLCSGARLLKEKGSL